MGDYYNAGPTSEAERGITSQSMSRDNDQIAQWINPNRTNPFTFLTEAYTYGGGFRSGRYLTPHSMERSYDRRCAATPYVNFMSYIVESMFQSVFVENASRVVSTKSGAELDKDQSLFAAFLENVDCAGTGMQEFAEAVVEYTRLHSITFVVMDSVSSIPTMYADAVRDRAYPYVYQMHADDLVDAKTDNYGNYESITFVDEPEEVKGIKEDRFRIWTRTQSIYAKKDGDTYIPIETFDHNLGIVPVIAVYDVKPKTRRIVLPTPKLYGLARLCHAIFDQDSVLLQTSRDQGFSIFYLQTSQPMDNMVIGTANGLRVEMDATIPPGFATPDPSIMDMQLRRRMQLIEDLFRLARQVGVVGTIKEAKSGVALAFEFLPREETLSKSAQIATNFEEACFELFARYIESEGANNYTVQYKDDFTPSALETSVDTDETILGLPGIPRKMSHDILTDVYRSRFPHATDEDLAELTDELSKKSTEEDHFDAQARDREDPQDEQDGQV